MLCLLEFVGKNMDSEQRNYEVAYLISPEIAEDAVFGEAGKITGFIQDARGMIGRIDEPKKRKLAYPINEFKSAYFGWTTLTVAPDHLKEIEKRLKAEKSIIRFLIVERVARPVRAARPMRLVRRAPTPYLKPVTPFAPQAPKEEDKAKIAELDKQLEEILGK